MSGSIAKKLRIGIIDKLKQFDCYIDNELPDYIMVLIANKKSLNQMKEDLSLFVGDHVSEFVDWLHYCLEEIKVGNDPFLKENVIEIRHVGIRKELQPQFGHQQKIAINSQESSTLPEINKSSNISINKSSNTAIDKSSNSCSVKTLSNEESKENSLKERSTTRKLIKFTSENNSKDVNEGQTSNHIDDQKNLKEEINQTKSHKRIVYNIEDKEPNQDKLLTKKFKSQISITNLSKPSIPTTRSISTKSNITHDKNYPSQISLSRGISSNSSSQINYKQSTFNKNSNLQTNLQSTYYQKKSFNGNQNRSNQQFNNHNFNINNNNQHPNNYNNFTNYHKVEIRHQLQQNEPLNILERIKRENQLTESIFQRIKKENQIEPKSRPMIFKAIAEANKQSKLESVSIRKQENSDLSAKKPLISRLGITSASTDEFREQITNSIKMVKKEENEDIRKEKRLIKFNQHQSVKKQVKDEQNEINNSEKRDLRQILERKRKLSDENKGNSPQSKRSPTKVISNLKASSNEIENDEELRILKGKIKPKSTILFENEKEDKRNNANTAKDENVDIVFKRELIEKIENIQGILNEHRDKLKVSANQSINQSSKEIGSAKKERCYFWPVCSNQNKCQFHHPKQICKQFPLCIFGEKCFNIHPNCKFDSKCTKADCPFTHLTRKINHASKSKPLQSTIQRVQLVAKKI